MSAISRLRATLFRQFAQCLMRLVEARAPGDVLLALEGLLQELPLSWYTVNVFAAGRIGKRTASRRCPRGFAAFVARSGFLGRADGTYQGIFADTTLLLVKVASAHGGQGLVAGLGLPKHSPLNDEAIGPCIGALIHAVLSRALSLDADGRRRALLENAARGNDEWIGLLDPAGNLLEQYPDAAAAMPQALLASIVPGNGRAGRVQSVVTTDGRSYNVSARSVPGARPLASGYWVIRAKAHSVASAPVVERLQTYGLSKREFEVAELVFAGKTNKLIADTLFISRDTVKTHCKHIFGKLGISRRTEFLRVMDRR
jgi:DNA-binding CsgD family transcriptional regulator